jgi:hypothetical protein
MVFQVEGNIRFFIYHITYINTCYFITYYNTCNIAYNYNVPVFSEEHWQLINNYMANAALYGINMILTPVFTPPLDTQAGGERPTVQLVEVTIENGKIYFCFDKLTRYIEMAEKRIAAGFMCFTIT